MRDDWYLLKLPGPLGVLGTVVDVETEQGFSRLTIQPFEKPGDERRGKAKLWCPSYIWEEVVNKKDNLMYFEVNPNSLLNDEPIICNVRVMGIAASQLKVIWKCGAF